MISKVFVIYDSKAEAYLPPFFMKSKGEAIRAVTAVANDGSSNFSKYAADFTLFELGTFDDADGEFSMYPAGKQSIACLIELKKDVVN